MRERFLYIHGFNSSPASYKARSFTAWCGEHAPEAEVIAPELSHDPLLAMMQLEDVFSEAPVHLMLGSSLGGYYATWLSEKYNVPAVLVNPAVEPWRLLDKAAPGWHTNYYSGKKYQLTPDHVLSLSLFDVTDLRHPGNFMLLVQTGDEVLDYRQAVEKYRNCRQLVQKGGSHAFDDFTASLPEILAWGRQARAASQPTPTDDTHG